jgi:uncharacterized protein
MQRAVLLSTLLLVCLAVPSAWSAQESRGHRQAATDLLSLMKAAQSLETSTSAVIDAQIAMNPEMAPFRDILIQWVTKYFDWDVIGPQLVDVYMKTFTEAELRELVAFYRTPTGRKALARMPVLMEEGIRLGQELANEHRNELAVLIKTRAQDLERAKRNREMRPGGGVATEVSKGWLIRATEYYEHGLWEDAKNAYLEYLKESPEDVAAMADLGVCYKELKDYDRAIRNFDRALVIDPGHWQALYNKIIVLGFNLGRKDDAKKLMRELRQLQPANPDVARLAQDVAKL